MLGPQATRLRALFFDKCGHNAYSFAGRSHVKKRFSQLKKSGEWQGAIRALAAALVLVLSVQAPAWATTGSDTSGQTVQKASKAAKKKVTKKRAVVRPAVEPTPSGESVAARERRLKRECKGRPNAGACLGFAS
jgi:uncharacterized protein (DUF934 family)